MLSFKNPNKAWVVDEFDKLLDEWEKWYEQVKLIKDYEYDKNTQLECYKDGVENLNKQEILCRKTLTFLENNISGYDFMAMIRNKGNPLDRMDLRLSIRVPQRIQELKVIQSSLKYAKVPDSFWEEQAKKLIDKITSAPDKALKIVTGFLKNPLDN